VSAGEIVCSNSGATVRKFRQNTSSTNVTFSDIDTGAEASGTTYYIYAVCDADATTATFKISASSSAPSGVTYYKILGSFYNDASSDIDRNKIYTNAGSAPFTDSSGIPLGQVRGIFDYGSSTSSYTWRNLGTYYMTQHVVADDSTITNLPYTSASSYIIIATMESGTISQNVRISSKTASGFTIGDGLGNGNTINVFTFGY
jgi:hypothetical protein